MVRYAVKKMLFKTSIFCSKVPSECGKYRFRDPKFKTFQGDHAPGPSYGNMLSLYREGPWAPSCLKWQGP